MQRREGIKRSPRWDDEFGVDEAKGEDEAVGVLKREGDADIRDLVLLARRILEEGVIEGDESKVEA